MEGPSELISVGAFFEWNQLFDIFFENLFLFKGNNQRELKWNENEHCLSTF